jgi:hypothetical protein
MYNIEYVCSYMDDDVFVETDNVNDAEKEFIRHCIYRQDLLNLFQLEIFDENVLNKNIDKIYDKIKHNPDIVKCVTTIGEQLGVDNDTSFMILYSFDYMYLTHTCVCELLNIGEISSKSINQLYLKILTTFSKS